jgi:hypothetical protein
MDALGREPREKTHEPAGRDEAAGLPAGMAGRLPAPPMKPARMDVSDTAQDGGTIGGHGWSPGATGGPRMIATRVPVEAG